MSAPSHLPRQKSRSCKTSVEALIWFGTKKAFGCCKGGNHHRLSAGKLNIWLAQSSPSAKSTRPFNSRLAPKAHTRHLAQSSALALGWEAKPVRTEGGLPKSAHFPSPHAIQSDGLRRRFGAERDRTPLPEAQSRVGRGGREPGGESPPSGDAPARLIFAP